MKNKSTAASAVFIDNKPNASKLINSLRHTGYDNLTAIEDLIDNSIDASSNQIWINISGDKTIEKISITDDGIGMSSEILMQAIKLGSDTDKNPNSDLGRYGMGLVTASISIAKKLVIYTKSNNDERVLKASQDLDEIIKENDFVAEFGESSDVETKSFLEEIIMLEKKHPVNDDTNVQTHKVNSATMVILEKIDRSQGTKDWLIKELKTKISRSFRRFLDAGLAIYINGEKIISDNQIEKNEGRLLLKQDIDFKDEKIKVLLYELKDYGKTLNTEKGYNLKNQGFSIIRNGREIMSGQKLSMFTPHASLALFRGEIEFSAALDEELKTGFTKSSISLSQSLHDKIFKIVDPQLKGIRARFNNRHKASRDPIPLDEVEKYITKQKHLLNLPKGKFNIENPKIINSEKSKTKQRKKIEENPNTGIKKIKRIAQDQLDKLDVDAHSTVSYGPKGPLFEPEIDGSKIKINWNEDHPFYNMIILETSEQPDIQWPIIFLIYAYAAAEINSTSTSDSEEILSNIRYQVGQNLTLLMRN